MEAAKFNQDSPVTTDTKEKMSKKQIIGMTVLSIIAIAGVLFGLFGMSDSNNKNQKIEELKAQVAEVIEGKTEIDIDQIESSNTINQSYPAPSISEVTSLLKDKYDLDTNNTVFGDGMFSYIDDLNDINKIIFTIDRTRDQQSEGQEYQGQHSIIVRSIGYDTFSNTFKKYFGNSENIEKKNYELDSFGLIKMEYNPDQNVFDIYYKNGLGGYSTIGQFTKVQAVVGTEDGFYALVTTVTIDRVVSEKAESEDDCRTPNSSDGVSSYYDISMSEEVQDEIQKSLSLYKFNFIQEDDEYKLTSIEKF